MKDFLIYRPKYGVRTVADPGGVQQVQIHPLQKLQKNEFLAIFEGFLPIRVFFCVSYYWERPCYLYKKGMSSYKPPYIQEFA